MKIDLLKIVEDNKKTDNLRAEAKFRKELNDLIVAIINDDKTYYTNNKKLLDKLELKYTKNKEKNNTYYYSPFSMPTKLANGDGYVVELTKNNINKIQEYVNKENK